MKITLNGQAHEISEGTTLQQLIVEAGQTPEATVVERNGDIVDRGIYPSVHIEDGDTLELVQFVGGG